MSSRQGVRRRRRSWLVAALLTVPAASCSNDDSDGAADTTAGPTVTSSPSTAVVGDPGAPTTAGAVTSEPSVTPAVEDALDDVLRWLADPAAVEEDRFTPAILAEVSADEIRAGLASLGGGDWVITDVQPLTDTATVATLQGPNRALTLQLELDADGRIDTLFFENAGLADPPESLDVLITRLEAAAETTGFLAAEIGPDGTCDAVAELRPGELLPVASAFKLYVVGAVADAVAAGSLSWDQPVTIRDALDSPGAGDTQHEPDGTTVPLRELAVRMVSVSDNTATDHLIDLVGREAVEAALATFGHADPDATRPLLTTREMSVLKVDPELLARYEAGGPAERRGLLASEIAAAPTPTLDQQWSEPRAVTTVEWFASPLDLCRALVALDDRSDEPGMEPLTEILATNPGMVVDPASYSALLFKGGSEPGVLVGAWLGRRVDGTRVVVAGGATSTTDPIDPAVIELVGSALHLL